MGMPVSEMLQRVSSRELTEWAIYFTVEPFGPATQYTGPAIVAKTIADVNRKKGDRAFKVEDFIPKFENETKTQTVDEMVNIAAMYTSGLGGKDLREED